VVGKSLVESGWLDSVMNSLIKRNSSVVNGANHVEMVIITTSVQASSVVKRGKSGSGSIDDWAVSHVKCGANHMEMVKRTSSVV